MIKSLPGMVLPAADIDYTDLKKFGRVTIDYTAKGVEIAVEGFEFADGGSCRIVCTKGMAWARDVLAAVVEADRLIPGGHMRASVD